MATPGKTQKRQVLRPSEPAVPGQIAGHRPEKVCQLFDPGGMLVGVVDLTIDTDDIHSCRYWQDFHITALAPVYPETRWGGFCCLLRGIAAGS